jgi:hypothetical protein
MLWAWPTYLLVATSTRGQEIREMTFCPALREDGQLRGMVLVAGRVHLLPFEIYTSENV